MAKYRRAKREDSLKPSTIQEIYHIGSVEDSFESLQTMCNDASCELLDSIKVSEGQTVEVIFITEDFPELIGISTFTRNENGLLVFKLSFDQSTL